jgi:hypothetical protein
VLIFVERGEFPSEAKRFSNPKILDSGYADRSHPARLSIRQLPPDVGVGADAPMAAFDFLCVILCDVVPEGAIVFARMIERGSQCDIAPSVMSCDRECFVSEMPHQLDAVHCLCTFGRTARLPLEKAPGGYEHFDDVMTAGRRP